MWKFRDLGTVDEGAKPPAVGRRGDHPREQAHYPEHHIIGCLGTSVLFAWSLVGLQQVGNLWIMQ
eukprot:6194208-Pleurochrysis_carterae.AAC.2